MDEEQEIMFVPDEPYREDEELPEGWEEMLPKPKLTGPVIAIGNG